MAEVGIAEQTARLVEPLRVYQDPARQRPDRAVEDAHVDVRDEMRDLRVLEQCVDEG